MCVYSVRFVFLAVLSFPALAHAQALDTEQDTWLNGNNPSKVLGGKNVIVVSNRGPKIGLIQFDTSSISNTEVESAMLDLFVGSVATGGDIRLHMVRSAWSEDSASFSATPVFDSTPFQTFPVSTSTAGAVIGVDISAAVQEWASDPSSNFGVALTSADAFVRFGSTEGPMAAIVNVSTDQGLPNTALVAKGGGDYTNPLDAIEDLDAWCDHTCTLVIGPGRFELTSSLVIPEDRAMTVRGSGRDVTILFSTDVATTISGSGVFFDLAVVNDGGDGSSASGMDVFRSSIENVRVSVSRAHNTNGINARSPMRLRNIEVRAFDTASATGITGEELEADHIDISIDSTGIASGYIDSLFDPDVELGRRGSLRNFRIRVNADGEAAGIVVSVEAGLLDAAHGTVNVSGGGMRTAGIRLADARIFIGRDLRVVVGSASGLAVGIDVSTFDLPVNVKLENSYIFAESATEAVGLRIENLFGRGSILVKHSELSGQDTGILFTVPDGQSVAAIDNSIVSGGTNSIVGQQGWKIGVGASKLFGATLPQESEMTCAFVYDENYNAFADSCP